MSLQFDIDQHLPERLHIGRGTVWPLSGWAFDSQQPITNVDLIVGGRRRTVRHTKLFRRDVAFQFPHLEDNAHALYSGFHDWIDIPQIAADQQVDVHLELGGTVSGRRLTLGPLHCVAAAGGIEIEPFDSQPTSVAICMATYRPDPELFRRQIDSIRHQTVDNWRLIIQDDHSPEADYRMIREVCKADSRIIVLRNSRRLGFYANFERALQQVGNGFEFVAFADQDDLWFRDKLAASIEAMEDSTSLVYSDLRITDRSGQVIHPSFWTERRNHQEPNLVMLANTVTGAASLFRRTLLSYLLPFPRGPGHLYHDHWLALTASMAGTVKFLDQPLGDYVQHGGNELGYRSLVNGRLSHSVPYLAWITKNSAKIVAGVNRRDCDAFVDEYLNVYRNDWLRLQLLCRTLKLRFGENAVARRFAFLDSRIPVVRLLLQHVGIVARGKDTGNAELGLLASIAVEKVTRFRAKVQGIEKVAKRLKRRVAKPTVRAGRRSPTAERLPALDFSYAHADLQKRLQPLRLQVRSDQPRKINLLIPEINFDFLFGGYLAKFKLAEKLSDAGYPVRIIVLKGVLPDPSVLRDRLCEYSQLDPLVDKVEIVSRVNRNVPLSVSKNDVFIATTWWTAHLAHAACRELGKERFLYLIQEFEPFIHPMGSVNALAQQSYEFPHAALFSTDLLEGHFRMTKAGVFRADGGSRFHRYFQNAILDFPEILTNKDDAKRLVMYARPDYHATRNMFDLAILALNRAIDDGVFDTGRWTFTGIGSPRSGYLSLSGRRRLIVKAKLDLSDYRRLLPSFDLGLSLMYTPHPSLVPLEMAAAGLITVTNTCLNKTRSALENISSNLVAAEPSVPGIVQALQEGVERVDDRDARRQGAAVNWPQTWDEAFDASLMHDITSWIDRRVV